MPKKQGYLGKDAGQRMKPGFPGRTKLKTVEGRTGYTENETRFGRNNQSTKIPLPKDKG